MIRRFFHYFAHLFGYNTGNIITYEEDGFIYVAFQCDCGLIDPLSIDKIESDKIYGK